MTLLITGGLGYLGSWLLDELSRRDVTVLGRSPAHVDGVTFLQCDLTDEQQCAEILSFRSFDVVIHAAGTSQPKSSRDALLHNALGTKNLLHALAPRNVKHFIYLSTIHVYGALSGTVTEESPLTPRSDYALSRLFGEYYVKERHVNAGLPYTILRIANGYGCPKRIGAGNWSLLVNDLARMAFTEKRIVLGTNGFATRDFIALGTVAKVIADLSGRGATNEIYNLSSESPLRLLDVAKSVQDVYQKRFGTVLPIETNLADKSREEAPIDIRSAKLKQLVPYQAPNRLREEIGDIFTLLERHGGPAA